MTIDKFLEKWHEGNGRFWPHIKADLGRLVARAKSDGFSEGLKKAEEAIRHMKGELRAIHGSREDCTDAECSICALIDCPFSDGLHYHHDGCPAEYVADQEAVREAVDRVWEEAASMAEECGLDIGCNALEAEGIVRKIRNSLASMFRARRGSSK